MNIAINAWLLRKKALDGIGVFTKETISRMISSHPEHRFFVLLDKGFDADYFDFANSSSHLIFPPLRHPLLYVVLLETVLPKFLKRHKIDLFIGPDGMLSLRSDCPQIPCIHDLNFVHQPSDLNLRNRLYYNFFYKKFARKAARIATVSVFSKTDICDSYQVDPEKVDVVYCGIKEHLAPAGPLIQDEIRQQYSAGKPYFLFVGSIHPRKNVVRLVAAFDMYKTITGHDTKLILVGDFMWDNEVFKDVHNRLKNKSDIVLAGHVDDTVLGQLYAAALALTFVPTYEGFGIPIVESFASGVPVICSNVTSLPEVAGNAAVLVDPYDPSDIAEAMSLISEDESYRNQLILNGFQRAALFSWARTAELLWGSCEKAVKGNPA